MNFRIAADEPDLFDSVVVDCHEAILIDVLLFPLPTPEEQPESTRFLGKRNDRHATEGIGSIESDVVPFTAFFPRPDIPIGVIVVGTVIVNDEESSGIKLGGT